MLLPAPFACLRLKVGPDHGSTSPDKALPGDWFAPADGFQRRAGRSIRLVGDQRRQQAHRPALQPLAAAHQHPADLLELLPPAAVRDPGLEAVKGKVLRNLDSELRTRLNKIE